MEKETKITVSESFFSIQGEGKTMGVPSVFLRLAGCNLMCGGKGTEKDMKLYNGATWRCDSIEVWRKGKPYTAQELVNKLDDDFGFITHLKNGAHLIITGGEPMLQQKGIISLINYLKEMDIHPYIEFETNGTIQPTEDFEYCVRTPQWNVSPKLENSGEPLNIRINKSLFYFSGVKNSQFKFVISNGDDMNEVLKIVNEYLIDGVKVWLMPSASDQIELNQRAPLVAEIAKTINFNYSHRLHITLWNKKTGV